MLEQRHLISVTKTPLAINRIAVALIRSNSLVLAGRMGQRRKFVSIELTVRRPESVSGNENDLSSAQKTCLVNGMAVPRPTVEPAVLAVDFALLVCGSNREALGDHGREWLWGQSKNALRRRYDRTSD
jgi:hypothetical protein